MSRFCAIVRRTRAHVLLILTSTALLGCMAAPVGQSRYPEGADFSSYRSFGFVEDNVLVVAAASPVNPALEQILVEEVRAYLTRRGFQYVPSAADADFTIGFAVGANPSARTTAFGNNYNQVRIVGRGVDDVVVTQESSRAGLLIDFYDRAGNKQWIGWAEEEITMGDQIRLRSTVQDAVSVILKNFPPKS